MARAASDQVDSARLSARGERMMEWTKGGARETSSGLGRLCVRCNQHLNQLGDPSSRPGGAGSFKTQELHGEPCPAVLEQQQLSSGRRRRSPGLLIIIIEVQVSR